MSWNVCGLGNVWRICTLYDLIRREGLDALFLQETRVSVHEFEHCKFRFSFSNCLSIGSCGRMGGLALLWGKDVNLSIVSYSDFHIHVVVQCDSNSWYLSGIYGNRS